jgi:hypothetical protein
LQIDLFLAVKFVKNIYDVKIFCRLWKNSFLMAQSKNCNKQYRPRKQLFGEIFG